MQLSDSPTYSFTPEHMRFTRMFNTYRLVFKKPSGFRHICIIAARNDDEALNAAEQIAASCCWTWLDIMHDHELAHKAHKATNWCWVSPMPKCWLAD